MSVSDPIAPTKDDRFLAGIDLDNPADIGRSIAMQIRTVGHYKGVVNPENPGESAYSACVVASAAFSKANSIQRIRFEQAVRERADLRPVSVSLVWWNDHNDTEKVLEVLESLPNPTGGEA